MESKSKRKTLVIIIEVSNRCAYNYFPTYNTIIAFLLFHCKMSIIDDKKVPD